MRNKAAFSLLEFLTYLALLFMYTLYLFGFLTHMHCAIKRNTTLCEATVRKSLFFDAIRRDIRCASRVLEDWDCSNNVFVQHGLDEHHQPFKRCVGYRVHDGMVQRLHGEYNFATKQWIKKTAALIGREVATIVTKVIGHSEVQGVELNVVFSDQGKEQGVYVVPRNGYV